MVTMHKRFDPAHTEYFMRVTRPTGEVIDYYNGCCYRKRTSCKADVDRYNANPRRYGQAEIASVEREGREVTGFTLAL